MDIFGYAGKTLFVDLSTGRIREEDLDRDFLELFVGGIGACARMAYDLIPPQIDPLSALNPIIIGTGPLTGTTVPASSKTIMVTKFPATHNIDGGSAGSALGPKLKLAGYDFLVIVGASEVPVYLSVRDDEVRICDASNIWGKDIYETTEELWKRHGENSTVMAIGPAGENMVKISLALVDKTHTLGKGGLGALMGGKKLKALVIDGRKGVKVYDPGKFRVITENLIGQMKRHPEHDRWVVLGRMSRFANFADIIGWPHKNCRMRCPNEITSLFGPENYVKLVMKNRVACPTCPSGCKDHVLVKEGKFAGLETYISSLYGRIMNWGSRCMVGGYNESMKCMDLCNRAGLCVHSFSALMDWAVDLYENKVINKTDTGGIELKRDFPTTLKLIDQTIRKEGFGATLAEGWLGAIKRIGRDCEKYAIQIKGVEPQFDPRSNRLGTVEFYQVTNPRGGWGSRGRSASYLQKDRPIEEFIQWSQRTGVPENAMTRIFRNGEINIPRLTRYAEDWCYLMDTLGASCLEGRINNFFSINTFADLYEAATGTDRTPDEIREAGERSFNMVKALNVREGRSRKDDQFPERWFEPLLADGKEQRIEDYFGKPILREHVNNLLDEYYDERQWDIQLGIPTKEKLKDLSLNDIADGFLSSGRD